MSRFDSPLLTVILAAKDPRAAQFEGCIATIAALRNAARIDLVIVASGGLPTIAESGVARLQRLHLVEEAAPRGVYHAYNRGLDEVETPYVMVMGVDDLLLPGLDNVIDSMARREAAPGSLRCPHAGHRNRAAQPLALRAYL